MGFSTTEIVVKTGDGRNFTILEPFIYTTKEGERIVVPADIQTDGASTPRSMWDAIPPFGKYWLAAILHDYLYRYTNKSKHDCDEIFYEAMIDLGVDSLEAKTMYEGVHLLGWIDFENDRKLR